MKLRPTIFLSGVSSEFRSFRDEVEVEIQKKGCFAENQSSFHPDYRTVEAMLRSRLQEANAVIHIVGFRFGAEPKDRPPDKPRRSYTQMEFDIAREMDKPVYVFLSSDQNVRDAASSDEQAEDAEATALQLAHREFIQNGNFLYSFFHNKFELSRLAAEIPQVVTFDFRADISRIVKYAPSELIGRDDELKLLNDAWLKVRHAESPRPHILTFVALGGEGKTSLVAKWLADLAYKNWPGCDSAFAWSFYSQGTREQYAASSDLFLKEALNFFGNEADQQFAASAASAYEKGQRLARVVAVRRSLLILDGLEPLQYSPSSATRGELKDSGILALLKGLAVNSHGLCVVTTRYSLPDLKVFWQTTAPEDKLLRLSRHAGVHLLKTLGVRGTHKELEAVTEEVKGHALTLNLLGTYVRDAHGGDIRRRDLVKLEEADAEEQGGHAFRVIQAYERAFEDERDKGRRAYAMLWLFGLFDRPISAACLTALLEKPAVQGLTEVLVGLSEVQRNLTFKRLEDAKLLTVNREASGTLVSLDAHPLLRDFFARQLRRQQPNACRAAHRRLFEHLCATTPDKDSPSLDDLQPLYQAVAHGCQAELYEEAVDVYYDRILRGGEHYTWHKLGAYGSELSTLSRFFEVPWTQPSSALAEVHQAWLLNEAAFCLRALGRLTEALAPTRAGLARYLQQELWQFAARVGYNLCELELTLGELDDALKNAQRSVAYADRSGVAEERILARTTHADVLHQIGWWARAEEHFGEAEEIQKKDTPRYPLLYSVQGFQHCDLLLDHAERAAWKCILECRDKLLHSKVLRATFQRAAQSLRIAKQSGLPLVAVGLDHLTLSRIALYEAVLPEKFRTENSEVKTTISEGVSVLRRSGNIVYLPPGLLTRAWLRFLAGVRTGSESAQEDLDEAWEIAERGPMRLHMADIHLYRARLFFREEKYPWESARKDLEEAERLINECGYHRRDEELSDAKRVILNNPR